jgi:hypothetical protein
MIRISVETKDSLLETAKLTGDQLAFTEAWYWSMDGTKLISCLDTTVAGGELDEERFWSAYRDHHEVRELDRENATLKRVYTDEEIIARYKKS